MEWNKLNCIRSTKLIFCGYWYASILHIDAYFGWTSFLCLLVQISNILYLHQVSFKNFTDFFFVAYAGEWVIDSMDEVIVKFVAVLNLLKWI